MGQALIADDVRGLLRELRADGYALRVSGDDLEIRPAVTPALRERLRPHKPALIEALRPVSGFTPLKGGLTLPNEVIKLYFDLHWRGIALATDRDHQFIVPNDPRLTAEDRAGIRRWRHHLGAIVEYAPPVS